MRTYKGLPEPEPYGEMTKDERNEYAKAKADAERIAQLETERKVAFTAHAEAMERAIIDLEKTETEGEI